MHLCPHCFYELKISNVISEDVWGRQYPVEWNEECSNCGYKGLYSYGSTETINESVYEKEEEEEEE